MAHKSGTVVIQVLLGDMNPPAWVRDMDVVCVITQTQALELVLQLNFT